MNFACCSLPGQAFAKFASDRRSARWRSVRYQIGMNIRLATKPCLPRVCIFMFLSGTINYMKSKHGRAVDHTAATQPDTGPSPRLKPQLPKDQKVRVVEQSERFCFGYKSNDRGICQAGAVASEWLTDDLMVQTYFDYTTHRQRETLPRPKRLSACTRFVSRVRNLNAQSAWT